MNMNVYVLLLLVIIVFVIAELMYKKGISATVTRKVVHIGSGVIISIFPYFMALELAVSLGVIASIVIFFLKRKKIMKSVFVMEKNSVGARIYVPALLITALLAWDKPEVFTTATLVLALADSFAAIAGKKFGRNNLLINPKKTVFGSLTFILTTFIIISVIFIDSSNIDVFFVIKIFFISVMTGVIEALSRRGWDNFFIPVLSAIMIYLLLWM